MSRRNNTQTGEQQQDILTPATAPIKETDPEANDYTELTEPKKTQFVVKDEDYVRNEEHGDEAYVPDEEEEQPGQQEVEQEEEKQDQSNKSADVRYDFRDSTRHQMEDEKKGIHPYEEKDTDANKDNPSVTGDPTSTMPFQSSDQSLDRKIVSLVSASHRKGRTPEERRQSAEKASQLYEQMTGSPLEINDDGAIVTGPPREE